ncbi:hypothetical protein [Chromobacterium sp. LK1]|uniref:Uncharacterized protein n=1 Tax=Chromobacterium aquaticum TaxID=467180 RepID=A0ABV8ZQW8_9NEIS|nr:hypothetical protein [Chromobacterium sp. LK1]
MKNKFNGINMQQDEGTDRAAACCRSTSWIERPPFAGCRRSRSPHLASAIVYT